MTFSESEFNWQNLTRRLRTQARKLVGYTGNSKDLDALITLLRDNKVLPNQLCYLCGASRETVELWVLYAIDENLI